MRRNVDALRDETFDLLILGGGITGAGVALDASLRGLRVALIDKGDFASGTSSVSSKLVHGGLRYLEQADFRLVYEALHERRILLRNAPHLVQPLRFLLPFYRHSRVPSWKWRLGLTLYDILAGWGNIGRSRALKTAAIREECPQLRADGLRNGAQYWDAQMEDARLCLEVIRTAVTQGARAANHVEAVAFETANSVRVIDHVGGGEWVIRTRQVLNATGPWVDAVCRLAGDEAGPHLKPTKGVHLVTPDRGFASAFLLLHPVDGRVFFVIPWLGKTLIGTTDTLTDETPDTLTVTDADVRYLLEGFNHHFDPPLEQEQILSSFVGLRPLLRARTDQPSALSREYRLFWSPSGLLSVAGGKYTTYRSMAEKITDVIVQKLGARQRSRTRSFPLDAAPSGSETATLRTGYGLDEADARHLISRYGKHAVDVAPYVTRDPESGRKVVEGEPDRRGEFDYQREHEMAVTPADCLLRRTRLGLFHPELLTADRLAGGSANRR